MKHSKQMLAAGILTAAVVGGGAFAVTASAATSSNGDSSLASKIASKFNLNKDEVQKVLNEDRDARRAEHRAEHQQRMEERLTQLVSDGKITEDQKTKILKFLKSQEANLENLSDKSEEERKAAFQKHREEVKKWAEDNGIDPQYVMPGGGKDRGMHHGNGMGHRGGELDDKDTN